MITLYLARHGQTEQNLAHIFQGQMPGNLTALGRQQAAELGERLREIPFDSLLSSDLARAYDMENPNSEPQHIALINLGDDYYRLQFLVDTGSVHINKEMEVSMQAGEIVGRIYDALIKEYDLTDPRSMRVLRARIHPSQQCWWAW